MSSYLMLLIASGLFLASLFIVLLHNFPWIMRCYIPRIHNVKLSLDDLPVFIVSDIHLGNKNSLGVYVFKIASKYSFRTMVIAGDLIDKRVFFSDKVFDLLKMFLVGDVKNVFYIPSSSSHDIEPLPKNVITQYFNGRRVAVVPQALAISISNCVGRIYITHGDYASRNGVVAHLLDAIFTKVLSRPFTVLVLRKVFNAKNFEWIIYGHTHLTAYLKNYRAVNTGCWIRRPHESMQKAFAILKCSNGFVEVRLVRIKN